MTYGKVNWEELISHHEQCYIDFYNRNINEGVFTSTRYLLKHFPYAIRMWFNPDKFDYMQYGILLPEKCHRLFDAWYYPDKMYWHNALIDKLDIYCHDKKDIWEKDYLIQRCLSE